MIAGRTGKTRYGVISGFTALFWCVALTAQAQSALSGIVHDPTGQVAVGATVIVFEDLSGHRWGTISNTIGYYEIVLPPGAYQVKADLMLESGQALTYTGAILVLANENTALDITLEYRGTDRVTVKSAAAPLTANNALGATFDRESLEQLPLTNGRTIQSLLTLVPGVVFTDTIGALAQFTAMGQRRYSNRFVIDGIQADLAVDVRGQGIGAAGSGVLPAFASTGGTQTLVPLSAVEEIQVRTSNAPSAQQRSPGAQTIIVTRRCRSIHGNPVHGLAAYRARRLGLAD